MIMADVIVPMVPTLGATLMLTNPAEILAYTVRHFACAPKSISAMFYNQSYSLLDLISRYGQSQEAIVIPVQSALEKMCSAIFGNQGSSLVQVSTINLGNDMYTLVINVQVVIGQLIYSVSPKISISKDGVIQMANDVVSQVTPVS